LEVWQIFGTLVADDQQVYDLNNLDDRLVLGIKGTLSVVELKVMRQRLQAGQEAKARRGELFKRLPVGHARDPVGKIMFHPDRRVCKAIQLIFAKFRELWSVRRTSQWFRDHDLELPANPIQGTRLIWKILSQSLIRDILRNPFYAGTYVWGRRPVTTLLVGGRLEKRQSVLRSRREPANDAAQFGELGGRQIDGGDSRWPASSGRAPPLRTLWTQAARTVLGRHPCALPLQGRLR
jgi:hypothetical protein